MTKLLHSVGIYSAITQPDTIFICTSVPILLNDNYFIKYRINVSTSNKKALLIVLSSGTIYNEFENHPISYGFNYRFHTSAILNQSNNRISTNPIIDDFIVNEDESFEIIAIYDFNFDINNSEDIAYINDTIGDVNSRTATIGSRGTKVPCCPPTS